jgi:hypothetical protein
VRCQARRFRRAAEPSQTFLERGLCLVESSTWPFVPRLEIGQRDVDRTNPAAGVETGPFRGFPFVDQIRYAKP